MKNIFYLLFIVYIFTNCNDATQKHTKTNSIVLSAKVEAIFQKMTLKEKIGQLNLIRTGKSVKTGEVVSKNVEDKLKTGLVGGIFGLQGKRNIRSAQQIAVNKSRLGIPLIFGLDVIHGYKTTFPIPLALSCSWDMKLIEQVAHSSAIEATSDGLNWTFSPMVDIARDPRWGRIAEGAGEDPFLGSAVAKSMVKGYQGDKLSENNTMLACVKHFANYGATEGGRDYNTVDMSDIRCYNEYYPPYKAAIDAGVGSIMTSFNVLNYIPATANKHLFTEILREQWGFSGFVVTDYTAINEMINHGIGKDLQEVSYKALNAGIDMDMVGEGFLTTLEKSLEEGSINKDQIDIACKRILKAKELLGLFDNPYRYLEESTDLLNKDTRQLARKAATESIVLLKNNNSILPLTNDIKIALIGPLANSKENMLGCWNVAGDYKQAVTVLKGVQSFVGKGNVMYAKGANITDNLKLTNRVNALGKQIEIDKRSPADMIKEAVNISNKSDVIVAVLGEAANMSGEASSMADISLQDSQKKLLKALKSLNKPIVLVLFNGRPMTLKWESENLDAILDVWFGGTESGNAVADVLFGKVNPSAKLTTSFPLSVGQIPVYHSMLNTGRPDNKSHKKFRSNYLDIANEPLFPFGYGLSYTQFEYGKIKLSDTVLTPQKPIIASIDITNSGKVEGEEIVQMYIRDIVGSISRPIKELKGFEKIQLKPRETKTVRFEINEALLRFYNSGLKYESESGKFEVMIGKDSENLSKTGFVLYLK